MTRTPEGPMDIHKDGTGRVSLHVHVVVSLAIPAFLASLVYPQNLYLTSTCILGIVAIAIFLTKDNQSSITMTVDDKAVVVTGCDTGFGHVLASHLASMGVTVFAGCLRSSGDGANALSSLNNPKLHVVQMDVTNNEEIQEVLQYVRKTTGEKGLWGIVNNAGLNFLGDIELTTMEQYERVCNINQLGMVRVTKAFLPLIRSSKGRVVNMTSCKGRLPWLGCSAYDMTKFAGEAFSDILRMEMNKFGVKVSIIEPCNFGGATNGLEMSRMRGDFEAMWSGMSQELQDTYGKDYVFSYLERIERAKPTACFDLHLVTNKMVEALFVDNPKTRYLIGGSQNWYDRTKLKVWMYQWLPAWYMDSVLIDTTKNNPKPTALTKGL